MTPRPITRFDPKPRAAIGHMPFAHRTCAEWLMQSGDPAPVSPAEGEAVIPPCAFPSHVPAEA